MAVSNYVSWILTNLKKKKRCLIGLSFFKTMHVLTIHGLMFFSRCFWPLGRLSFSRRKHSTFQNQKLIRFRESCSTHFWQFIPLPIPLILHTLFASIHPTHLIAASYQIELFSDVNHRPASSRFFVMYRPREPRTHYIWYYHLWLGIRVFQLTKCKIRKFRKFANFPIKLDIFSMSRLRKFWRIFP